ncbi:SGNH/GDSL hydrolase family protein [Myroides marinus]|uniref:Lysophospholipase L1 n=1 Tax=Myroides marinus TaxID=703342 RepID=A0A1H6TER4_9FLAO|nr:GDSL-type esterase/lipase family protein [Myroides marinus]MDM1378777.1 SGNH/GDSL hydrolase family protein [Myroides marinus]MDM1386048.1 SGNH/GDSL hydrolase family protein [Myroides marinus]MDM1393174.1 SGNH/GDSL hydrolase family protein [Myroides marinus]SEI76664.1 Lysophospholipase L1 [Myroides marinus]
MKSTNCLFFGDSITFGEYDGVLGGWVDALKRYSYDKFYNAGKDEVNVFNLGIGGETTEGLLRRVEVEIAARTSVEENLVFFFYGANDLAIKNGGEVVSIDQFNLNLEKAINIAKKITDKVYLISILPISSKVEGVLSPAGKVRTSERVLMYNEVVRAVASRCKVELIDLYPLFADREELLSKDGIHPNERGYEVISEVIKPYIDKYLG